MLLIIKIEVKIKKNKQMGMDLDKKKGKKERKKLNNYLRLYCPPHNNNGNQCLLKSKKLNSQC